MQTTATSPSFLTQLTYFAISYALASLLFLVNSTVAAISILLISLYWGWRMFGWINTFLVGLGLVALYSLFDRLAAAYEQDNPEVNRSVLLTPELASLAGILLGSWIVGRGLNKLRSHTKSAKKTPKN